MVCRVHTADWQTGKGVLVSCDKCAPAPLTGLMRLIPELGTPDVIISGPECREPTLQNHQPQLPAY